MSYFIRLILFKFVSNVFHGLIFYRCSLVQDNFGHWSKNLNSGTSIFLNQQYGLLTKLNTLIRQFENKNSTLDTFYKSRINKMLSHNEMYKCTYFYVSPKISTIFTLQITGFIFNGNNGNFYLIHSKKNLMPTSDVLSPKLDGKIVKIIILNRHKK